MSVTDAPGSEAIEILMLQSLVVAAAVKVLDACANAPIAPRIARCTENQMVSFDSSVLTRSQRCSRQCPRDKP